jgi:S-ribosylhomocysteine lyase
MADIDHRCMLPPFLRITERIQAQGGGAVYLWDLRIAQPNVSSVEMPVMHSVEHFLTVEMRSRDDRILNVGPMGCQTGLYITAVDFGDHEGMSELLSQALGAILDADQIPLADVRSCGWAANHSLAGAKNVAGWLLRHRDQWETASTAGGSA